MMVIERVHLVEDSLQIEEKDTRPHSEELLPKLDCKNYGFDCNFIAMDENIGKTIKEFREHIMQEHYIDYSEGVLMKFITNKKH